ncbi:MAG: hypothetical protein GY747_12190 [Planctomycetes bacterium]|nr:hypothetical protein [Planctomycetota bacterium]MCP4771753.1 hypothetical protein [Planctomycetota bacterium]MCP4861004.1 hypothetical protein [Planctomycetota bacterium]
MQWPSIFPLILALSAFSSLAAQQLEDHGPFQVGWRDVSIQDVHYGRGNVQGRIYYPATSAGYATDADGGAGPFPLVSFMHGWTQPASDYDDYCSQLASWGFVVMSNDTETALLFVTMQSQAKDTRALMQWVEDESQDPQSWLQDMVDLGDWSTIGHSMGGGSTSYLLRQDSRVRTVVMFEPYFGPLLGNTSVGFNSFDEFSGSVLVIGASQDLTNNWWLVVRPWFDQAEGAGRRAWALIEGGDHFGATDWAGTNGFLSGAEQHRLHRRYGTGFLRAEVKQEPVHYHHLLGAGSEGQPVSVEAAGWNPALWVLEEPSQASGLVLGAFGDPGARLRVGAALGTGQTSTPWGTLGLDMATLHELVDRVVGSNGIEEQSLAVPSNLSGNIAWFQGLLLDGGGGTLSPVTSLLLP